MIVTALICDSVLENEYGSTNLSRSVYKNDNILTKISNTFSMSKEHATVIF